jgi:hypothetical protein
MNRNNRDPSTVFVLFLSGRRGVIQPLSIASLESLALRARVDAIDIVGCQADYDAGYIGLGFDTSDGYDVTIPAYLVFEPRMKIFRRIIEATYPIMIESFNEIIYDYLSTRPRPLLP